MPSTVSQVFDGSGLTPAGVVQWGQPVPETAPGVYVVALTAETELRADTLRDCPLDRGSVEKLLRARPELRLDGSRPTAAELEARLASFWLGDEVVVYIGLAGTSVQSRVNSYYRTPLGARSPHAGGWPLKTLSVLSSLRVHFATCADPAAAEQKMLGAFADQVSSNARANLHDPAIPVPFANLEHAKGQRKQHGITGARAPRKPSLVPALGADETSPTSQSETEPTVAGPVAEPAAPRRRARQTTVHVDPMRSQRITAKDIQAGRIRFPSSAKPAFPPERTEVAVTLRDEQLTTVPWHPHYDHDHERSSVLRIGHQRLAALVQPEDVLSVHTDTTGRVVLT